jgi:membrane-associated phospholipid phosphatase
MEEGTHKFNFFRISNDYLSMPSGDATAAFAVSSALSEKFGNTYASIGLYSLATLTAFSRVYDDQHWLSDTFFGAAIGTFMGVTVAHLHKRNDQQSLHIYPTPNGLRAELIF